ncbi:hypothetical protein [Thermoflexibacter ruber]|nr:hypothetical protein [Thermoflexibacter ruber]
MNTVYSTAKKIYALVIMLVFIIPNAYFVIIGDEDFPFTCAPMFGHYVGDETQFYNFKFIGEFESKEEFLPPKLTNVDELSTMRFFFIKVYSSCEETPPFGTYKNDNWEKLSNRLSIYFKSYLKVLAKNQQINLADLKSVRLEVWRYGKDKKEIDAKNVVGHYDITSQKFIKNETSTVN